MVYRFIIISAIFFLLPLSVSSSKRNNADTVMKKVFDFADKNKKRIRRFESSTYIKFLIETKRKNSSLRLLPGMLRLKKGENRYFGESVMQYNFSEPNIVDSRDIAFYSTMPNMRNVRKQITSNINLSIYEPSLMQDKILSPLNRKNRKYYSYHLDSISSNGKDTIQHISVTPRFLNTQLVTGKIQVDATEGFITKFIFRTTLHLSKIKMEGTMGKGDPLRLLPQTLQATFDFKLLGNNVKTTVFIKSDYNGVHSNEERVKKSGTKEYDLTHLNQQKNDTTKTIRDLDYFDKHRPIPLTALEDSIYKKTDSDKGILIDTLKKKKFFSESLEDLLLSVHDINIMPDGNLSLPPIITPSMFLWSKSRGVSIQTKIKYNHTLPRMKELSMALHAGYNFKLTQFYWKVPANYTFSPSNNGKISMEIGNGNRIYSSKQADEIRKKLEGVSNYDSLQKIFNSYDFNYFNDFYAQTHFAFEPLNGFGLRLGLVYHSRTMKNWNKLADKTGLKKKYESLAPSLRLIWTPQSYYYRNKERKVALYSKFPTFTIDFERGIKIAGYKNEYERWEFDASYKLPLHALRSIYMRLGGGLYTTQKNVYFVDFTNFNYNNMPRGWEDELLGEFQLLERHWYNESNYYARLCMAYESPMLCLSRLRLFTRFITTERIYCNILMVNALKPYLELGYGMSTNIGSYAFFVGGTNGSGVSAGAKVTLYLFEN